MAKEEQQTKNQQIEYSKYKSTLAKIIISKICPICDCETIILQRGYGISCENRECPLENLLLVPTNEWIKEILLEGD